MLNLGGGYNTAAFKTLVTFPVPTFGTSGGNVNPSTAIDAADILIYRAAYGAAISATERSSTAGITVTSPFDSTVGAHTVGIDLTNNTDTGFYAYGYCYYAVLNLSDETIDGESVKFLPLATWEIEAMCPEKFISDRGVAQSVTGTTVLLRSATPFTADDVANNKVISVYGSNQGYWQTKLIDDYVASTQTCTVGTFTVTPTGSIIYVVGESPSASTANLPQVNSTQIGSVASANAIRSAVGMASANLDTQLLFLKSFMSNWAITNATTTTGNLRIWPTGTAHINGTGELAIIPVTRTNAASPWTTATL